MNKKMMLTLFVLFFVIEQNKKVNLDQLAEKIS
jgi:hypothetical protein